MEGGGAGKGGGVGGCGGGGGEIASDVPQYAASHRRGCGSLYVYVSVTPASYEQVHTCTSTLEWQSLLEEAKHALPTEGAAPIAGCGAFSQPEKLVPHLAVPGDTVGMR